MVTVINKDNSKWRLIYNNNILLLDKANKLSFDIEDKVLNFKSQIEFIFSESGEKLKSNIIISDDGLKISITLNQWDSSTSHTYVEVTEPLKLTTVEENRVWLKYRTQTNEKTQNRNFHLSVWGEEVKQ